MNKRTHSVARDLASASMILLVLVIEGNANGGTAMRWFGNDARNAAMGGAGLAVGQGPGNLLLNPALMSFNPGGIWLGFSVAPNWLKIDVKERDSSYDVPSSIYGDKAKEFYDTQQKERELLDNWESIREYRPVPTEELLYQRRATKDIRTIYQLHLSYIFSGFKRATDVRIGVGMTLPLPEGLAYNIWYNDEREQHFTNRLHFDRFGEFDTIFAIYPGISYAPWEWFSFGISTRIDFSIAVDAGMYVPDEEDFELAYVTSQGEIVPIFRPIAGLAFKTPIGLRFGLSYHHRSYSEVTMNAWARVWNGEEVDEDTEEKKRIEQQRHTLILGYEPSELMGAVAYERGPFQFEFTGAWTMWSYYLDRHNNDWNDPSATRDWKDPEFSDTFTMRVGSELWVADFAAVRLGMAYYPSPMPDQTGRYNYVDNDVLMYSVGGGFKFPLLGWPVTVDLAAQIWHMPSKTVEKDRAEMVDEIPFDIVDESGAPVDADVLQTNNPGFPGYTLGGVVFNAFLMVGTVFN